MSSLEVLAVLFVTTYVTGPLLLVIHELGHAVAVLRANGVALIEVGRQPPLLRLRTRRLEVRVHPQLHWPGREQRFGPGAWGVCRFDPRGLSVGQLRAIVNGGPLAEAAVGFGFALIAYAVSDPTNVAFWIAALGFVGAIVESIINLTPGELRDGTHLKALEGWGEELVVVPPSTEDPREKASQPPPSTR